MEKQGLILVTGGARSGKSSFGESLLTGINSKVLYIATSQAFDDEMRDRISKHRESRPPNWVTIEGYKNLYQAIEPYKEIMNGIFLDCITIMVTNLMLEKQLDWEETPMEEINALEAEIFEEISRFIKTVQKLEVPTVLITNEVGLGIVPENKLSRVFRDIAGRANQYIAKEADEVYFVVCGIPNKIK